MENTSLEEWVKLFKITERFKEVSPWQWIANEDIFAVVNPQNGEIGYCSILGNGGQLLPWSACSRLDGN